MEGVIHSGNIVGVFLPVVLDRGQQSLSAELIDELNDRGGPARRSSGGGLGT